MGFLENGRKLNKLKKINFDDKFFDDALYFIKKIHREDELLKKRARIANFDRELEKEMENPNVR